MNCASVQTLAQQTSLSYVTVNNLIRQLLESTEVLPGNLLPSAGGRPSQTYRFRPDFRHAAVVYGHTQNGRDTLHLRVTDLCGKSVYRSDLLPDRVTLSYLMQLLADAFAQYPDIAAVGIGLPGEELDGVVTINDYTDLVGTRLTASLSAAYGVPVFFENDINAAILGFSEEAHASESCTVGIYFPGKHIPGAGILLNGEIYRGKQHFAGELRPQPFGIDWLAPKSRAETLADTAKLCSAICCLLAPDTIVLYGESLPDDTAEIVAQKVCDLLSGKFCPQIVLSHAFEPHFEKGMIRQTLERVEEVLLQEAHFIFKVI